MRPWPVLLLLLSCSRPNPLFLDEVGGAATDLSLGTDATSSPGTGATTGEPTGPVTTTSEATSTSGGATGSSSDADTTGTLATGTSEGWPLCGPFADTRIEIDPPLGEDDCIGPTEFHGEVDLMARPAQVALCLDAKCTNCGFGTALDPGLIDYLEHGACLTATHAGLWLPGDPEAETGCKTTGFVLHDDNNAPPLYIASSRVLDAPAFLPDQLRLDVSREPGEACTCDPGDCCLEGQARRLRLRFMHKGQELAVLGAGEYTAVNLGGASYALAVVRAHVKGQPSLASGTCVDDPEAHLVDWHMLRLSKP